MDQTFTTHPILKLDFVYGACGIFHFDSGQNLSGNRQSVGCRKRGHAMKKFRQQVYRFLVSEDGPTAVEYAVMLAMIIMVCIAAIGQVGLATVKLFTPVTSF